MPRSQRNGKVRWIRPLPERLINKIAAGEVIERPAAVVKELVENALDAGAEQVDIIIEKSGTKLIKIVDNGCGIPEEQIEVAFSRHATSKILDFADLDRITSYGFRGEALPSIASVSRTTMVSRTRESDVGTEIIFEGGVLHSKQPVAAPPGTTVEVENLFFNTPARRKFLKSEATEARHISRVATAMAIGSYAVGFSFRLNGREVFTLPKGQDPAARVAELLTPGKKLLKIEGTEGPVKVEGYIGLPDMVQSNRYGQFLFINGRNIQSASFSHAFMSGYGELMPRGSFPIGALLLTVDPSEVDVNVHPGKTEVRLSHEREIYSAIYHLVKETVRQDSIIPSFRPGGRSTQQGDYRAETGSGGHHEQSHVIPGIGNRPAPTPDFLRKLYDPPNVPTPSQEGEIVRVDTGTGEIIQEPRSEEVHTPPYAKVDGRVRALPEQTVSDDILTGLRLVGRFSDLYLLFQAGETLLIVDQHTAHERVLYERTLKQIEKQQVVGQQMLLPIQLELTPEQFALFDEVAELLNGSGFVISHFGGRMLNVEAVPAVLTRKAPEKVVMKVLDDLASMKKAGFDLKKAMAQSIACRAAVMSGDRLSPEEAEGLVKELLKCENRYSCPHGRPTFIRITRDDLDRQFGRG